jgi:hypothetical protein
MCYVLCVATLEPRGAAGKVALTGEVLGAAEDRSVDDGKQLSDGLKSFGWSKQLHRHDVDMRRLFEQAVGDEKQEGGRSLAVVDGGSVICNGGRRSWSQAVKARAKALVSPGIGLDRQNRRATGWSSG